MPADHGTPNTGDERDREVEAVARALTDYPDEWEEHEEGDKDVFRRMAADAIAALDRARVSPSRDGTVAVEDVERAARAFVRETPTTHPAIGQIGASAPAAVRYEETRAALLSLLAEFGVSERIHDQATKEGDERRH